MKQSINLILILLILGTIVYARAQEKVGVSPWGAEDEVGALNMSQPATVLSVIQSVNSGKIYDLSVDYFVGMPSFHQLGDPGYQYWLTHTPRGTIVDNPNGMGRQMNTKVSYTGDAISMYTHMGTHIDALNHFGLDGQIWNGYKAEEFLGDKGWKKSGAETIPPIIARGVLLDIASFKGVTALSDSYRITADDIKATSKKQRVEIREGDVVLIRTGQAQFYDDQQKYLFQYAGISLDAVKWLVEEKKVMLLGADNLSLEAFPSEKKDNWVPVHTYLLAEKGVMFIEQMYLEELAGDQQYVFAFIAASLKLKGASGAPMRPVALPVN